HAVLGDVAVAAEALLGVVGVFDAPLGQAGLGDRREEADQGIGTLARGGILRVMGDVELGIGRECQQAAAFDQRLLRQQHAAHVGLHQDRVSRLVGILGAGQRARLQAFAGIAQRVLVGAFG